MKKILATNSFIALKTTWTGLLRLTGVPAMKILHTAYCRAVRSQSFLARRSRHLLHDLRIPPGRPCDRLLTSEPTAQRSRGRLMMSESTLERSCSCNLTSASRYRRGAPTFGAVLSGLTQKLLCNGSYESREQREVQCS